MSSDEWTPFTGKVLQHPSFNLPTSRALPIPLPIGPQIDNRSCDLNFSPPPQPRSSTVFRQHVPVLAPRRATILYHGPISIGTNQLLGHLNSYFSIYTAATTHEAKIILNSKQIDAIITKVGDQLTVSGMELISFQRKRAQASQTLIIVLSKTATQNCHLQTEIKKLGANIVTDSIEDVVSTCVRALKTIGRDAFSVGTTYTCPLCGFDGIMEDELCDHVVLYHGGQTNTTDVTCPICDVFCGNAKVPFPVHLHKTHGAVGRSSQNIPKKQHLTLIHAVVVCQRKKDGKFLLIDEPASFGWFLPGGRVEWGEGLRTAAIRHVKESSDIDISIQGVVHIEYISGPSKTKQRVFFYANPIDDDAKPKSVPNYSSRGACWVTANEVAHIPLRAEDPMKWFSYVANGGAIYPASLFSQ